MVVYGYQSAYKYCIMKIQLLLLTHILSDSADTVGYEELSFIVLIVLTLGFYLFIYFVLYILLNFGLFTPCKVHFYSLCGAFCNKMVGVFFRHYLEEQKRFKNALRSNSNSLGWLSYDSSQRQFVFFLDFPM